MDKICRVKLHEGGSHVYTGEVEYDGARGNLAKFTEKVGTGFTKYETTFGYDTEDRPVTLSYGDTNNQTILTYDGLGRVTNRTVKVGGYSFNTIIGYTDGAYGINSTTGLLRHMFQGNENFVYYYDNVGNISYMYRTGKYTGYVYDNLGQLIRVNDETDTTSGAAGTTWTYEYDRGGNIISKSRYAYTTGVLGTALETIVYGYGDYNWMDKMTHYNYLGVSYDDIGNPTSFNGWNCTWDKGRQLKEMTDNSVNTIYYKYNADGLRVQKRKVTIYGSDVTTNYILHGKNIVHMTQGTDTLHFWYDAQGRPAIVEYNGTKYAYIHNLQGDIVGIIDSTGAEVVQYTYDAWGKVLSTAGTMASTLGTVQPFRYRGYVYDVETGLYYLRSRYYNPEWGRFINADKYISISGLHSSKRMTNLFSYCNNLPISQIDVNGDIQHWDMLIYSSSFLFLYFKGWHRTNELFHHALRGSGDKYIRGTESTLSKDIASNEEAKSYFHKIAEGMENNTILDLDSKRDSKKYGSLEFKQGDLHYALQHVDYKGMIFKDNNGSSSVKVTIYDKFDFTQLRIIESGITFSNVANDFGFFLQHIGSLKEFDIEIEVEMRDI